jgi:hypothetical protein
MRAKELKICLSSLSQAFSGLDESKKADKLTLDLSPKLFNPDESKRAEKMLELALSQIFSGLDESKKANKPTLYQSWVVFIAWMRAR